MSIKSIATELYRAQKRVEQLENQLKEASFNEKEAIQEKLRVARAELHQMRRMLDGAKTPSPFSPKSSTFRNKR